MVFLIFRSSFLSISRTTGIAAVPASANSVTPYGKKKFSGIEKEEVSINKSNTHRKEQRDNRHHKNSMMASIRSDHLKPRKQHKAQSALKNNIILFNAAKDAARQCF